MLFALADGQEAIASRQWAVGDSKCWTLTQSLTYEAAEVAAAKDRYRDARELIMNRRSETLTTRLRPSSSHWLRGKPSNSAAGVSTARELSRSTLTKFSGGGMTLGRVTRSPAKITISNGSGNADILITTSHSLWMTSEQQWMHCALRGLVKQAEWWDALAADSGNSRDSGRGKRDRGRKLGAACLQPGHQD